MEGPRGHRGTHREPAIVNLAAGDDSDGDSNRVYPAIGGNVAGPEFRVIAQPLFVKSVDTAPGLERLREPGFQKLSKLCCMRSTPTEMQSMNENDFECLAKTRVNTPPMAKMTDDVQTGSYFSADSEVVPKSASRRSPLTSSKPVSG